MIPLADVIASFQRAQAEVRPGLEAAVGTLMSENAQLSKDLIGREHPFWPPLAPSTVAEKQRLGYTGRRSATDPLLRSGDLEHSIEPVVHPEPDGVTGEVGTDVRYARALEQGDARMPPRPFLSPPFALMQPRAEAVLGELANSLLMPGRR